MVRDPVRAHERIALHFLAPHRRVRLVEAALPGRGEVLVDGVVVRVVAEQVPRGAVRVAIVVVVAVDEQALDAASVRREVVREHLVPHPGHGLKLLDQPVVGHVPADHDSVHAPVAEPLQRAAERRLPAEHERAVRAADREMDVRDDAEHEVRRAARKQPGRRAQDARGTHRGGHPADKPSARNVHLMSDQENYRMMIVELFLISNSPLTGPIALNGAVGRNTCLLTESHSAARPLSSKMGRKFRTSCPSCQIFSQ